jgi:hypothetical protein
MKAAMALIMLMMMLFILNLQYVIMLYGRTSWQSPTTRHPIELQSDYICICSSLFLSVGKPVRIYIVREELRPDHTKYQWIDDGSTHSGHGFQKKRLYPISGTVFLGQIMRVT